MYTIDSVQCTGAQDSSLILEGLALAIQMLPTEHLTDYQIHTRKNILEILHHASRTSYPADADQDYETAASWASGEYCTMMIHAIAPELIGKI